MAKKIKSYYNYGPLLSHNAQINLVMGARGTGKSYGAKKLAMRRFIEKGEEFIYLRRYKTELKTRDTFFNDIAHEFPKHEFRVEGLTAQCRLKGDKEWATMGYFCALSVAQTFKSTPFPLVTTVIFDEFIIDKGVAHYLPNEVDKLLDFYSTVDRYDDRTKILMLSNSVSIMNPYMAKWKISPCEGFARYGDGFICAEFIDSEAFKAEVRETRFGSFITKYNSDYADYSIENVFADNNDDFVMKKSGTANYFATVRTGSGIFSIWMDGRFIFIQSKRPKNETRLVLDGIGIKEGEVQVARNAKLMQNLRRTYRQGFMYFESPQTRNIFRDIFEQR